jgi:arylformamidase
MRLIDLTHALVHGQPSFPGDPALSVTSHKTVAADRVNLSLISMGSHQGTHLDAMAHFVEGGRTLEKMPLEWFHGPARLIRIPKRAREEIVVADLEPFERFLTPGARIIYETGWHREFGKPNYFADFPSLTQDAARYLASRRIRLLGMDTPTPGRDWYEVHHILLGEPAEIVVVESLAHLDLLPDTFTFIGFPLPFAGRDGSPIRAVALVD